MLPSQILLYADVCALSLLYFTCFPSPALQPAFHTIPQAFDKHTIGQADVSMSATFDGREVTVTLNINDCDHVDNTNPFEEEEEMPEEDPDTGVCVLRACCECGECAASVANAVQC